MKSLVQDGISCSWLNILLNFACDHHSLSWYKRGVLIRILSSIQLLIWDWLNRNVPPADRQMLLWAKCQKITQHHGRAAEKAFQCYATCLPLSYEYTECDMPQQNFIMGPLPCRAYLSCPMAYGHWKTFERDFLINYEDFEGGRSVCPSGGTFVFSHQSLMMTLYDFWLPYMSWNGPSLALVGGNDPLCKVHQQAKRDIWELQWKFDGHKLGLM